MMFLIITDRFSCFVDPQIPVPLRIEQLTHISNDMVKDAKTIDQVLPEFLAFIEGSYLTAHNAGFDVGFITENARRLGLYEKPFTYADTLGIARAFLPNLHNYRLETVAKELGIVGTRWAIWLPGIFSPFAVYMLTKYMRRIPYSLYEAAAIDGAGEWQIFSQICMPICRGGLVSIAILIFIDYWNMVEQPLILLDNEEMYPLSVFLSRINAGEISLAFAVAVIYMVLPMLFFLYGEEYLVEGILYQGGIKE